MSEKKKKVPQLRFPEFSGEWEERKLGDMIEKMYGGASISPDDYKKNGIPTVPKGAVNSSGETELSGSKYVTEEFYNKNFNARVYVNDLVTSLRDLVPTAPNMGRIVKLKGTAEKYLMSQGVYRLILNSSLDEDFLISFSNTNNFRKIISKEKNGTTQVHIRNLEYLGIPIFIPAKEEQFRIGNFLKQLDNLITLHQRKLTHLQTRKKGLLQKMFPKDGELFPEVRHPGFTDAWEQQKLGELGTVQTCKRIFKEETSENGEIPFYKNGTLGLKPDSYISRERYEEFKRLYSYPEVGDILISVVGSIGRTAEYTGKDEYFQDSNVVWLKTDDHINKKFLKTSYQVINWIIEGSTIKHLYNDNILRSEIMCPKSQIEQQKIGDFFQNFDNLITLHQRKLKHLQDRKKALLQQMFV